jgi:twitching motility protein PilT
MDLIEILKHAKAKDASDIFFIAGQPITFKVYNELIPLNDQKLMPGDTEKLINTIFEMSHRDKKKYHDMGDDDFSFSVPDVSRFRVSTYRQRGSMAAVIRMISFQLPNPVDLGIPDWIIKLAQVKKGLVLVTGPAGSGKSTTQACMIDAINNNYAKHIITLEDPIEHLHSHKKSIVSQREITIDSASYINALRAALRQAPDVILLGEMRDYETIDVALTAAETGHLIFSTLHTLGATNTIDRIIDVFPASEQSQVAMQLSMALQCVVSMQLVPDVNGQQVAAFEIMTLTPAIRNMIRENKIPQIEGVLYASNKEDMISMDNSLLNLYKAGKITKETAIDYATNPEMLKRKL